MADARWDGADITSTDAKRWDGAERTAGGAAARWDGAERTSAIADPALRAVAMPAAPEDDGWHRTGQRGPLTGQVFNPILKHTRTVVRSMLSPCLANRTLGPH